MKNNLELKKYYYILKRSPLFQGIDDDDLDSMLSCLGGSIKEYDKNEIIFLAGSEITSMGIVLSGSLNLAKDDILGNRMIITEVSAGELFAESYACAGTRHSPITVIASNQSKILFLGYHRFITSCTSQCGFHHTLVENMLMILANKNLQLNQKMILLSKRTTREKLLEYFQNQIEKQNNLKFEIPFSRNELADYLCVDRSALSRELGKLRDEGIIKFHKNQFHYILKQEMHNY
ncbi:CRP-like cAMP-binding protein [Mobilisporobacter senegalensis]|uniref:CRP-like cAMP-binding protein n=1 Tax=Mobilisporobacter senegalensis TaxID=1329262 RepID=A0A3N1Y3L8_9FIRM|nr:Crp/Fnr family transcriptional regulator [Mobilisporobacter senegalensis]ROR31867.1 CRP-like cAMP-binding protein [Mobilisporobacter senegalensis]